MGKKPLFHPIPIRDSGVVYQDLVERVQMGWQALLPCLGYPVDSLNTLKPQPLNSLAQWLQEQSSINMGQSMAPSSGPQPTANPNKFAVNQQVGIEEALLFPSEKLLNGQVSGDSCSRGPKKSVRKQTSFAKTEAKSEVCSIDDLQCQSNFQLVRLNPLEISTRKLDGNGGDLIEDDRSDTPTIIDSLSYSCEISTNQEASHMKNDPQASSKMVGLLTAKEREVKVRLYLAKKRTRMTHGKVKYECRQDLAQRRFRFQGRFIKSEDIHKLKGKLIIDFNARKLLRPLFKVERFNRKTEK